MIKEKKNIFLYKLLSFLFIFSISLHNIIIFKKFPIIKISEIIFIFLILSIFFFDLKKIVINLSKIDFYLFIWPLINVFEFALNGQNLLGVFSSLYVFLIYFVFKNLFLILKKKTLLKYLVLTLFITSTLSIFGWITSQFGLSLGLTEYKEGFPIYIIEKYRSHAFFPTPNMLFFFLSIIFLILLNFDINNKKSYLIYVFIGILLTLSKSLIFFIPLILFPFIFKNNLKFKKIYILIFIIIFLIFNILTNFIIAPKKINIFKEHNHLNYKMSNATPLIDNQHLTVYRSNYAELKIKSFKLIKENLFIGIGFDNFRDIKLKELEDISVYKPHSSITGLVVENGIISLLFFFILFIFMFKKVMQEKNYYYLSALIFISIESINMDIHYFKILWVLLPLFVIQKNKFV